MDKLGYVLSQPAEADLEEIFDYSEAGFGWDRAVEYLSEMEEMFYQLCANPELGRERNDIRDNLRSIPCASHIIFYRVLSQQIRIVRVLHASRDLQNFLKPE